jgi:hypothetical protein
MEQKPDRSERGSIWDNSAVGWGNGGGASRLVCVGIHRLGGQ